MTDGKSRYGIKPANEGTQTCKDGEAGTEEVSSDRREQPRVVSGRKG